jgi:hypothetical protein
MSPNKGRKPETKGKMMKAVAKVPVQIEKGVRK